MVELIQKGKSRCFVFKKEDIKKVKSIIQKIDEFESEYLPDDWVTVWNNDENDLVYNGKFDIDVIELTRVCGENGIGILIRSTNIDKHWCS